MLLRRSTAGRATRGFKMRALVACLVAGGIAGCSGSKSEKEQQKPAAAPARSVNINVATATTGGAYYPIGNAIAQLWNDKLPQVRASAQATNGTPHNIQLLARRPHYRERDRKIEHIVAKFRYTTGIFWDS